MSHQVDWHAIRESMVIVDGCPRPVWSQIYATEPAAEGDRQEFWEETGRCWLDRLRSHFGSAYRVVESEQFLCMTGWSDADTDRLLRFAVRGLASIKSIASSLLSNTGYGKWILMAFSSEADFLTYVSHYFPEEGEFDLSGGVCIQDDYVHVALAPLPNRVLESAVNHELMHALTAHRSLPLWLDEALAIFVENATSGRPLLQPSRTLIAELRNTWQEHSLSTFWTGEAFGAADERRMRSYELAEILGRTILGAGRDDFDRFVSAADWQDAGNGAAELVLGIGLAEILTEILGPGDWSPPTPPSPPP